MRNCSSAATQGIVAIVVGDDASKVAFHVYKTLLMEHSEYFRKALRGPWKEAKEQSVVLKVCHPRN